MSDVILSSHGQCMSPKPFAIVPIPSLTRCPQRERAYYDGGRCAKNWTRVTPRSGKIDNPPCRCDVEPDLRQISVAIGMRLTSHLHQSDYRQKHDQVPTPPNDEIRISFSQREDSECNRDQQCRRTGNLPDRKFARMMVGHREIGWPNHLPDVNKTSPQSVGDSPCER